MATRKKIKKRFFATDFVKVLLLVFPVVFCICWSTAPAFTALYSAYKLDSLDLEKSAKSVRRDVQKNFRKYNIYVPLEDVVVVDVDHSEEMVTSFLKKTCGRSKVYVWLPLRFRVPYYGDIFKEYCWKPRIKSSSS